MRALLQSRPFRLWIQGTAFGVALWVVYLIFASGGLDESVAGLCYSEVPENHWPLTDQWWVKLAFHGIPLVTGAWGLATIGIFVGGFWSQRLRKYRSISLFCLLLLSIGPGLIINGVLKDHWGRPRPRDTVTFNGTEPFQVAFVKSDNWGKSFPCGHCSIGFALSVFAFWNRRRTAGRRWVRLAWGMSLVMGSYLGVARMASGGHYLSDVLVSAILMFGLAWLLDSFIPAVRWAQSEQTVGQERFLSVPKGRLVLPALVLSAGCVTTAGMAFPFHREGVVELKLSESFVPEWVLGHTCAPRLRIGAIGQHVSWRGAALLDPTEGEPLQFSYRARGFAFPWSEIEVIPVLLHGGDAGAPILEFDIAKTGFFKELTVEIHPQR